MLDWTLRASPADGFGASRGAYSPSLGRIAAGSQIGSTIITSDDLGLTWSAQTCAALANAVYDVAWSAPLGLFVAVGQGAGTDLIATSPDGITWTGQGDPWGGAALAGQSVAWDDEAAMFVAGAQSSSGAVVIVYSTDGTTWNAATTPWDGGVNATVYGFCWVSALSLWLALGTNVVPGDTAMTSPDGSTWSNVAAGPFSGGGEGRAATVAADGTVVAVGSIGSGAVATSADLVTWTPVTTPADSGSLRQVARMTDDTLVAVGFDGGLTLAIVESADDGATWTADTSPFDGGFGEGIVALPAAAAVAFGNNGANAVATGAPPPSPPNPTPGTFIWVGKNPAEDATTQTSPDGATWTARTSPFDGGSSVGYGVAATGPGSALAVGSNDDGSVLAAETLDSGATWAAVTAPWATPGSIRGVFYAAVPGVAVALGDDGSSVGLIATGVRVGSDWVWTTRTSPFDNQGRRGCYSPELDVMVAVGSGADTVASSSDGGATWDRRGDPFGATEAFDVCWSPELGLFVAVGKGGTDVVATSPDGAVWTGQGNPTGANFVSIAWDGNEGLFVIGTSPDFQTIVTTPDATTFTPTPNNLGEVFGVAAGASKWVAVGGAGGPFFGGSPDGATVDTSPLGDAWTIQTTPLDGDSPAYAVGNDVAFIAPAAPAAPVLAVPTPGDTVAALAWSTPFDGESAITGYKVYRGTSSGGETLLTSLGVVNAYLDTGLTNGVTYYYKVTAVNAIGESALSNEESATPAAPPPPSPSRFFQGYEWRFLFTDLSTVAVSWASGLLTNRQIALLLDESSVISADVRPNNRQVNEIFEPDADPRLAQQNRLLYAFRREGGTPPWKCRAAGLVHVVEDQGDADTQVTHIAAYDAWKYLEGRPVMNAEGGLPAQNGFEYFSLRGDEIILALLEATVANEGPCFIDFGQTSSYAGTIEATELLDYRVSAGAMVGSTLSDLCNVGHLDIVLDPVYDPIGRPGITHELSVYNLSGAERPSAVFGWDRFSRGVGEIDRMRDGTPGNWVNKVLFYSGQDGFPAPIQVNAESVAKYTVYYAQQFFPDQSDATGQATLAMAMQALKLGKQGLRTTTVTTAAQRSPIPLRDYHVGDRVRVYATKRLRVISAGFQRVQGIPIQIDDDGIEKVAGLLLSPDWVEPGS